MRYCSRRILRDSGVGRCFTTVINTGYFGWDFDPDALDYEERLLAGRYVITTSLHKSVASTAEVVRHYKMLANVERRFRVMKDFLGLRLVYHRTEDRLRAHIALCVIAAVIEAVIGEDLAKADVKDPDIADQVVTPRRALAELANIRHHRLDAGRRIELVDRPTPTQRAILDALSADTSDWNRVAIA